MKAKLWSLSRSPKRSMGHLRGMMAFVLPCRFLPTHSVGRGQIGANGSYGASSWPHSLCLLTTWLLVPGFSSIVQPLWISLCDPDAAISIPQIPFRSAFLPPLLPQPRCLFCFGFDALLSYQINGRNAISRLNGFIIKLFRALKMLISNVTEVYSLHVFGYTILFISNQYFLGVLFSWVQFGNPQKITAKTSFSSEISLLSNKALIVWNKSNSESRKKSRGLIRTVFWSQKELEKSSNDFSSPHLLLKAADHTHKILCRTLIYKMG